MVERDRRSSDLKQKSIQQCRPPISHRFPENTSYLGLGFFVSEQKEACEELGFRLSPVHAGIHEKGLKNSRIPFRGPHPSLSLLS